MAAPRRVSNPKPDYLKEADDRRSVPTLIKLWPLVRQAHDEPRRRASSGIKFRNRFNPPERVQLARSIQTCHLLRDSSTDSLRARIGYDQAQLAQATRTTPLTHGLHSISC
jgi:hypothetical protein